MEHLDLFQTLPVKTNVLPNPPKTVDDIINNIYDNLHRASQNKPEIKSKILRISDFISIPGPNIIL